MSTAYQCTADGFYIGEIEDYGLLPNGATHVRPPVQKDGFAIRFDGKKWEYVEDHKGKSGYLDGKPFTMNEYGPLPKGFGETPPPPSADELAGQVRSKRDALLAETDKFMIPDFPIDPGKLDAVKAYRKALRDITKQAGFPKDVEWPVNPME